MHILVTGKQGQVVNALKHVAASTSRVTLSMLGRPEADLADPASLRAPILALKPDIIISAAAYTAVDAAESEPDLAMTVNATAPGELAKLADELGIPILHLSTDYVFGGDKSGPYVETDPTGPINTYGRSKLSGEQAIMSVTPNHVILRTAWVYSPFGANFVKTMLRLAETRDTVSVVADQFGCPTSALEIARVLLIIARRVHEDPDPALRSIFHLTAQGQASWAEFAEAIFAGLAQRGGKIIRVESIATSAYPTLAKRPLNSRLSDEKLSQIYDLKLAHWLSSLDTCLDMLLGGKGIG
jgi:dTDP-4-dehydrorhamnose reductase